mgnify:CR=1 FL=1
MRDITRGFPVTGWLPDSQVFPKDYKPPSMSVQTLHSLSKGLNERVKAKLGSSNADFLGEATWEETEKELQEGWMEVDLEGGKDAAWAMRFGLQQRDKIRVIDDFSIAGVNHTAGLQERLKIFGIDDIAALIAFSMDTFEGEVHPALLGKTMDLKSAYKQFGICVEDRQRIRVATRKPTTSEIVLSCYVVFQVPPASVDWKTSKRVPNLWHAAPPAGPQLQRWPWPNGQAWPSMAKPSVVGGVCG